MSAGWCVAATELCLAMASSGKTATTISGIARISGASASPLLPLAAEALGASRAPNTSDIPCAASSATAGAIASVNLAIDAAA
jgi:hypothetical protein